MQNNSKLNTIIVILLVILIVIVGYVAFFKEKNESQTADTEENQNEQIPNNNTEINPQPVETSWEKSPKLGIWYPPNAYMTESYYLTPAQQGNGAPENQGAPYIELRDFTNSEMTIIWGGAQSGCGDGDYNFEYGVSTAACVKGMLAYMGMEDVRYTYTTQDLKVFGDFVIKNK